MLATKLKVASALFLSSFIIWLILILLFAQPTDSVGQLQFSNFTLLALFLGSAIAASLSSMAIGLNLIKPKMKLVGIAQKFKRGRAKPQMKKPVPVFQKQLKKGSTGQRKKSPISQTVIDADTPSLEEGIILPETVRSISKEVTLEKVKERDKDATQDIVQVESSKLSQLPKNVTCQKPTLEKEMSKNVLLKDDHVDSKNISCPKCSKVFRTALITLDYSKGHAKMVKLCPYCNSALATSEDNETALGGCQHWFGYLKQKEIIDIPNECLNCKKVLECMLKETYSTEAVEELEKWLH